MKNRVRSIALVLGATIAIAFAGSASAYPGGSDGNHPENWENQFDVPATCVKVEPGAQSPFVDFWFSSGVVLSPGEYVALIIKAGSDESTDGQANKVYLDPTPGNLYTSATGKDISHIIVCTPKEVEPSSQPSPSPSVEPSPSIEPTPSPVPSSEPTQTPLPSVTPEPSSTPSSPTPTPTSSSSVPPVVTVTAPPTDTEPTTTPSAPSKGNALLLIIFAAAMATTAWKLRHPVKRT